VPAPLLRRRIGEMLTLVGLAERGGHLVSTYSGGMRRRLEIARGLLHQPRVLFLDEPTIGLDPQTRAQLWAHLREVREQDGTTLFLTTHYLDEAEQCDRIAIIDEGRIVAEGSPAALKSVLGDDTVELRTEDDDAAREALLRCFGLTATAGANSVRVRVEDGAGHVPRFCSGLGVRIEEVTVTRPSLDDVFLHHTGRRIREDAAAPSAVGGRS
jgi:ABC-2 type transport system ATP-binding protein